ncbi:hypothetical protein DNK34_23405 [Pseudomonas dryadis]|uniref:Lysozyme inhibitor LprI-like N-terminal domain-containing protein n=2 Tax=Pseudomonadales TaxID=72274 RepID=A0A4Q9QW54_9GAMM|nr:lysozyme inhibitor LprI family protein [Pseudomonas dryadis]TBU86514.1 hypothetical protein DNK44_22945 [Pseudomonas dryadis]TBV00498.1 hypothetical protein DNK34_23405 [Pseudomonas dryadis]TBV13130.1 hypothetical protein DNK41_23325 [Pseudomonas sp. FRB 230]
MGVAVVLAFSPLMAVAEDCMDTAVSQTAMNGCARQAYEAADKQLNAVYREVTGRLADEVAAKQKLVAAQRSWIAFRDAECDFASSALDEGSARMMVDLGCLETLTRKRIADFQAYLDCPEGDLSCPLPRGD